MNNQKVWSWWPRSPWELVRAARAHQIPYAAQIHVRALARTCRLLSIALAIYFVGAILHGLGILDRSVLSRYAFPIFTERVLLTICLFALAPWGIVLLARYQASRLLRLASEAGYYLCLQCGYNLTGLGESNTCPECGNQYSLTENKLIWDRLRKQPEDTSKGGHLNLCLTPVRKYGIC